MDPVTEVEALAVERSKTLDALDHHFARAYFEARRVGRLTEAMAAGPHSKGQVLQMTRAVNEASGRSVRWDDEFTRRRRGAKGN